MTSNSRQRIEALEKVIPVDLPPCLPEIATRVLGLYLRKCGNDPANYVGDLSFMYDTGEAELGQGDFFPLTDEEEAYYRQNVAGAIAFWHGRQEGRW